MKQLPKTKILDMQDLEHPDFVKVNNMFNSYFGKHWPEVPLRRWEYVAAIVFSEIIDKPGHCLDAGCGVNVFSKFLEKIGCQVACTDIGQSHYTEGNITYYGDSMHDMKFMSDLFDYVFAISSIEHVNAGRFKIDGMPFDTGDTEAMKELVRVLKPGGKLILTTDYADKYYPPPGLWPSGSHRIYDEESIIQRIYDPLCEEIVPVDSELDRWYLSFDFDWSKLHTIEPKGYNYTEAIFTFEKC